MQFKLIFQPEAQEALTALELTNPKKHRKVLKTLGLMENNLRHPSLNTHKYDDFVGPNKEIVFESYAENNTSGAYRVFWYYGPGSGVISILTITPHP